MFVRNGDPVANARGRSNILRCATMILGEKSTGGGDAPYDGERRAWDATPANLLGSL